MMAMMVMVMVVIMVMVMMAVVMLIMREIKQLCEGPLVPDLHCIVWNLEVFGGHVLVQRWGFSHNVLKTLENHLFSGCYCLNPGFPVAFDLCQRGCLTDDDEVNIRQLCQLILEAKSHQFS